MPEALVVAAILAVAVAVYLYALLESRNPARQNAQLDLARLRQHTAWLQDRLRLAEEENWDGDMVASISTELELARRQLAELSGRLSVR